MAVDFLKIQIHQPFWLFESFAKENVPTSVQSEELDPSQMPRSIHVVVHPVLSVSSMVCLSL